MRFPRGAWFLVALLLAVGPGAPLNAADGESTAAYLAIQRTFLREDFTTVTALAESYLSQYPEGAEADRISLWYALSLDRLQRSPEALAELERLKRHLAPDDPLWPELLFWEGDVSRRSFQLVRAKLAYQQLLDRFPASTWTSQARLGLGLIFLQQQAFESALGYFHDITARHPQTAMARDALLFEGVCHLQLKRFKEAATIFNSLLGQLSAEDETVRHEPTLPNGDVIAQTALYLGESFSGLNRYEEAVPAYQRAITVSDGSRWGQLAEFGLGWARFRQGRCDESVVAFDRYLMKPVEDHRIEALFAQGTCLTQMGREIDGRARFERVIALAPNHPLALESGLALVDQDRQQGRLAQAKALVHTILRWRLDPAARAMVQLKLGAVALEEGNAAQARTVFTLASENDDHAIRQTALAGLGDVQMFLGDLRAATGYYEEAIQVSDQTAQADYAAFQIGRIRLQEGAFDEAAKLFQRLVERPNLALSDEARLALALTHLNHREPEAARSILEEIGRRQPGSPAAARVAYYEALLALGEGDDASARRLCEEVLRQAPGSEEAVDAQLLLADFLARETSTRQASAALSTVYESTRPPRQRGKLAKRLGELARSEHEYAEAIGWYEVAVDLLPSLKGEVAYRSASCYEEVGDLELAMRWYRTIEQPPWRVRGLLAVAKLLEREGSAKEAESIYTALASEPVPEAKVAQERLAVLRGEAREQNEGN